VCRDNGCSCSGGQPRAKSPSVSSPAMILDSMTFRARASSAFDGPTFAHSLKFALMAFSRSSGFTPGRAVALNFED